MQMYDSGASIKDIRAAIEAKYHPLYTNRTPTPPVPSKQQ